MENFQRCVAPVRERGLKYASYFQGLLYASRSRKGAWIEIALTLATRLQAVCRSRKGAWIEISVTS